MKLPARLILLCLGVCLASAWDSLPAAVALPAVLGPGMVLQREREVPVWGTASPGEKVTVAFGGQTKSAEARADGRWKVMLDAMPAEARGRTLTVTGSSGTIALEDVLVGEVWVCAGQSNMQLVLKSAQGGRDAALAAADSALRLFSPDLRASVLPRDDGTGRWEPSTPETAAGFSAVGYFFGKKLREELGVPVGLIKTAWGGQSLETFLPRSALDGASPWARSLAGRVDREIRSWDPKASEQRYAADHARWQQAMDAFRAAKAAGAAQGSPPREPSSPDRTPGACRIFNGMVAPIVPFGIRGVIWYQGEANRGDGMLYREKMETLVSAWRKAWGVGDFPFLFVQLAPCKYFGDRPRGDGPAATAGTGLQPFQKLPVIWQAQLESLKIPETGMAVTVDLDGPELHPARKREVGERLALWALAGPYGKAGLVFSGPLFREARAEGRSLRILFDHADGGLSVRGGGQLTWFEVAGEDRVFHPATARIDGRDVVASSELVPEPRYVRLGWDEIAQPNLMNLAGLPASPFTSEPADGLFHGDPAK